MTTVTTMTTLSSSTAEAGEDAIYQQNQYANATAAAADRSATAAGGAAAARGGAWVGIDLGTTNCAISVYSIPDGRAKLLRLGGSTGHGRGGGGPHNANSTATFDGLAKPPPRGGGSRKRGGKIVPSSVLFLRNDCDSTSNHGSRGDTTTITSSDDGGGGAIMELLREAIADGAASSCEGIISCNTGTTSSTLTCTRPTGTSTCSEEQNRGQEAMLQKGGDGNSKIPVSALIGHAASEVVEKSIQVVQQSFATTGIADSATTTATTTTTGTAAEVAAAAVSSAYVTSVKRVLGLTRAQAAAELVDNDSEKEFVHSLPFRVEIVPLSQTSEHQSVSIDGDGDGDGDGEDDNNDNTGNNSDNNNNIDADDEEGVLICIDPVSSSTQSQSIDDAKKRQLKKESTILVRPTQIAALLFRSLRLAAQESIVKHRLHAPGVDPAVFTTGSTGRTTEQQRVQAQVRNCVVGVPAHFGRIQRMAVVNACRMAGFDGHVSTITESTAAAMAYGIFVSSGGGGGNSSGNKNVTGEEAKDGEAADDARDNDAGGGKAILVFDMGGGTTDVTIAVMTSSSLSSSDIGTTARTTGSSTDDVRFKVVATAGDRRLGGDDLDEALAQYVWTMKLKRDGVSADNIPEHQHRELRQKCRVAKEKLCGNGDDPPPAPVVVIEHHGIEVDIAQEEFNTIISPLVERAATIIDEALSGYADHLNMPRKQLRMNEVVLVGGGTRVPSIRAMLGDKFPPPTHQACGGRAQGAAVQAAILSGCVPRHELRSALMLDALPHTLGVLVPSDRKSSHDEAYIPILQKDMTLPAMDCSTFYLADINQPGITVVAVEDVGDDFPLQRVGEFTFLLRKLPDEEKASLGGRRKIQVGFTVEQSGKFIVSIFDEHDPDHLAKKRRYLEAKRKAGELAGDYEAVGEESTREKTKEEYFLNIAIALMIIVYFAVKVVFAGPPEEGARIL
mmetsp:Transcript_5633/g.12259  ORF Transcript_5633/g.12259 Transcript_5633/m.12259 type:complete len:956 (+) Transcript_5633:41-2908(+)